MRHRRHVTARGRLEYARCGQHIARQDVRLGVELFPTVFPLFDLLKERLPSISRCCLCGQERLESPLCRLREKVLIYYRRRRGGRKNQRGQEREVRRRRAWCRC